MIRIALSSVLIFALGGCLDMDTQDLGSQTQDVRNPDIRPNGHGGGTAISFAKGGGKGGGGGGGGHHSTSNGINYHGGPVMLGTTNVYYIWYGTWNDASERAVLTNFAENIGGSPYFNINTTYYDGNNAHISNSVALAGQTNDNYSRGASNLADSDIQAIVTTAINSGALPSDESAVYFVLTSADVTKSGFCSSYCGWHTHMSLGGADIKYSFIGNAEQCPTACQAQSGSGSISGYQGADGMASIIAHELEEAASDPDLNAWYDRRGYENADKCAWTFGSTYSAGGGVANVNLGGQDYLIQQNWVNASGGYCAMSY